MLEDNSSAAQIELEDEEENPTTVVDTAHAPHPGSWAAEPSTLCPEMAREDLEHQVIVSLTKKLAERAAEAVSGRSRQRHSQVDKDALENSCALSLSRKHCVSRIVELLTDEETLSWSKNTESLILMLSSTSKLSDFSLSQEGDTTIKEGC